MALTTYAILHAVHQGHLSPEDAANALGIPVRNVKTQVQYFGERLKDIAATLDDLTAKPYPSRGDLAAAKQRAAKKLGVSARQINRFLGRTGAKPRPESIIKREEASEKATERKRQHRLLAIDVLYGRKTLTEAANLSGRHERSIRRVLDDLPIPVRYPDFDRLDLSLREALAKNLETGRSCDHLATLVSVQINRTGQESTLKGDRKPLLLLMIAWLEGESDKYDPGFERFLEQYGLKGVELTFWERLALADELRHLL